MINQTIHTQLDSNEIFLENGRPLFPLTIDIKPAENGNKEAYTVTARLDLRRAESQQFISNIKSTFSLQCGLPMVYKAALQETDTPNVFEAQMTVPIGVIKQIHDQHDGQYDGITCRVNDTRVLQLIHKPDFKRKGEPFHFRGKTQHNKFALTISEIRQLTHFMSEDLLETVPYKRSDMRDYHHRDHAPRTDLHTHMSAQLSPEDLFAVGVKNDTDEHPIGYPLDLLELTDMDTSALRSWMEKHGVNDTKVHGFRFNPAVDEKYSVASERETDDIDKPGTQEGIRLKDLDAFFTENPQQRGKFMGCLAIKPDAILGAADMDRYFYRFRNPLEKNPLLTHDKVMKIAEVYAQQGVSYAELSTGSMLNPQWLKEVLPALEEAEEKYGVKLRLLVGIPRSASEEDLETLVEKMRVLAHSPYIVGADLLGFELNKTDKFDKLFEQIHEWADQSEAKAAGQNPPVKSDFSLRIHAGENAKNRANVRHAIQMADKMGISLRIGHAIYGDLDDKLFEAAKKTGTVIEFIPDSNIALDSVDFLSDIPIAKWAKAGVRWVLGSDGSGSYLTSNDQLAKSAINAGVSTKQLEKMVEFEEGYIATQDALFHQRQSIFNSTPSNDSPASYDGDLDRFIEQYAEHAKQLDWDLKVKKVTALYERDHDLIDAALLASGLLDSYPTASQNVNSFIALYKQHSKTIDAAIAEQKKQRASLKAEGKVEFPDHLANKTPILLAGASGNSWGKLGANTREECKILADMLLDLLDRNKVYFVRGRVKDKGFERCFEYANGKLGNVRDRFDFISTATADAESGESVVESAWNLDVQGGLIKLAGQVNDFMEEHKGGGDKPAGYSLYCGGAALTRMFIREARERGLPHGLMSGAEGSSQNKARTAHYKNVIESHDMAISTVLHIAENMGAEVFKDGKVPSRADLEELYEEKKQNVVSRQLEGDDQSRSRS